MKKVIYYEAYSACLLYKCFAIVVAMVVVMLSLFFFLLFSLEGNYYLLIRMPFGPFPAFHPPASL